MFRGVSADKSRSQSDLSSGKYLSLKAKFDPRKLGIVALSKTLPSPGSASAFLNGCLIDIVDNGPLAYVKIIVDNRQCRGSIGSAGIGLNAVLGSIVPLLIVDN
jgi:hypothetical protein